MRLTYLLLVPLWAACGPVKGDLDSGSSGGTSGNDSTTGPGHSSAPTTIPDGPDPTSPDGPSPTTGFDTTTAGPETTDPTSPGNATTTDVESTGEVLLSTTTIEGSTTLAPPDSDDGGSFIVEPDPDPPGQCSPWLEDCPAGEKCMPVDVGNVGTWNTLQCRPVSDGATAPGTACTVDGGPFTGVDSCQQHAMCFGVDDELKGDCVGMCTGAPDDASCPAGLACAQLNGGLLNLCLTRCDPLAPACLAGDVCVPLELDFVCAPGVDDPAPAFASCEFLNGCAVGTACLNSELAPQCDPDEFGCCLPFCPLDDPDCPVGLGCVAWHEPGQAPPGLELVGVCIDQP